MKISIKAIHAMAQARPEGYVEDVLSNGRVDGEFLIIDPKKYRDLIYKYAPIIGTSKVPMRGLGDAVAKIAQPIAKAIDAVAGTNVQGCGGCKKRQEALNKMVPFNK